MNDLSRRDFLAAVAATLPAARVGAQTAVPSLKDGCRGVFLIGTAFDFRTPTEFTAAEIDFIRSQFNAITPENSMKPGPVHPEESSWNWTQADALVQFGQTNDIRTSDSRGVVRLATNGRSEVTPTYRHAGSRTLRMSRRTAWLERAHRVAGNPATPAPRVP